MTTAEAAAIVAAVKKLLLRYGVEIEWNDGVETPIGLDPSDSLNPWVALSRILYKIPGMADFVIAKLFRCDGASVPRWLWLLLGFNPTDTTIWAAFPHDAAYRLQTIPRAIADMIFQQVLLALNPHDPDDKLRWKRVLHRLWVVRSYAMYYGVRVFGRKAWFKNLRALEEAAAAKDVEVK
jgi:hypothetical protein